MTDILDDFDATEQPATSTANAAPTEHQTATSTATSTTTAKPAAPEPEFDEDDFARQLQQGMEQLMREMETNTSARNDFEALVRSMSEATGATPPTAKDSFSETLSRTMERMQESEVAADQARNEASSQSETDAFLAEMMKQLDAAGG